MKRIAALVLIVTVLLTCLCACSPAEQPKTDTPPAAETPAGVVYESPEQEAVVKTALAFLARSSRIQYDDSRFSQNSTPVEYRWQHSKRSPEDYTTQYLGYTNCAAFTHDVFLEALDYDILSYTTASLTEKSEPERVYKFWPRGDETEEEMAAMEAEFRSKLKMGDIIVIRYNGSKKGNGHAMLYVGSEVLEGNDGYRGTAAESSNEQDNATNELTYDIIHSTGSSYSYSNYTEKYENYGSVQITSTDMLFNSESGRYVFGKLDSIAIVRPLNIYEGGVPQKTQNRVKNMENIVAEKLSSHPFGTTVNPGDEITYSFVINNKNDKEVTLDISDTIPGGTTYVGGAASYKDGNVSWNMSFPAKTTITLTYTVKVNADALAGDIIHSDAGMVGGVDVDCPPVYVARTLTAEEQALLIAEAEKADTINKSGTALANAIYKNALGTDASLPNSFEALMDELYTMYGLSQYILNEEGAAFNLIVPGMFGGRFVSPRVDGAKIDLYENIRTRLPYLHNVVVGDILVATDSDDTTDPMNQRLYLVLGETSLELNDGGTVSTETILNKIISYNRFAILRPSVAF